MKLRDCTAGERKHDSYYPCYDEQFERIQEGIESVLEIGVQYGGSLELWSRYFPNATIEGVDVKDERQTPESREFTLHIGDQADEQFLNTLGTYDIIIDDGGHKWSQQQVSFRCLWPKIKSGGCYVMEDLHTSYWSIYNDEALPTTDVLKNLVDSVNRSAYNSSRALGKVFTGLNDVRSLHFYDSLCFIWKS